MCHQVWSATSIHIILQLTIETEPLASLHLAFKYNFRLPVLTIDPRMSCEKNTKYVGQILTELFISWLDQKQKFSINIKQTLPSFSMNAFILSKVSFSTDKVLKFLYKLFFLQIPKTQSCYSNMCSFLVNRGSFRIAFKRMGSDNRTVVGIPTLQLPPQVVLISTVPSTQ